jgi:hypothetical protein
MKVELELDDLQCESLRLLAKQYPHGWHTADLVVRKDAIERRYEADWVLVLARSVPERPTVTTLDRMRDGVDPGD